MKKNIYTLFIVLLSMICTNAFAHDIEVKNADDVFIYYRYMNNNSELAVTYRGRTPSEYSEYTGKVVIPSSVTFNNKTYPVTHIGSDAFRYCSRLTSVTIPNSVTSIGLYAFQGCSGLTSVEIPNSVTEIAWVAFCGCSSLASIEIPNSVTSIGREVFSYCSSLTSVTIPNSVTSIGDYAFYSCASLTSIEIPSSVKSIGASAFSGCSNLTSVTIPNSVTSIKTEAFYDCSSLISVIMQRESPIDITYNVFTNRANATLYVPQGGRDAYKAADYWKEFKEIIEGIPSGIKSVENDQISEGLDTSNWYTLDGRRLNGKPTQKGIYIVNGRKIVVK